MFRPLRVPRLAWFLALMLVFSQLVTAAYACVENVTGHPPMPEPMASSMGHGAMAGMADCEMTQKEQPVACKVHCERDSQSSDARVPNLPPPVLFTLFVAPALVDAITETAPVARPEPPTLVAASPPLRLQYQVFRN